MSSLFREEVLEEARKRGFGSVRSFSPPSQRLFAAASVISCLLVVAWLTCGTFTEHDRLNGSVINSGLPLLLSAPRSSRIYSIDLRQGDTISAGQAVARLIDSDADGIDRSVIYTITSPISGKIAAIRVAQGEDIAKGDAVAEIQPLNGALEAIFAVPAKDIGFLPAGKSLKIQVEGFPTSVYGYVRGEVRGIALSRTPDSRYPYLAIIKLDDSYMSQFPVASGVLVSADLALGRARVWTMLSGVSHVE